jgi:hypothetical protein
MATINLKINPFRKELVSHEAALMTDEMLYAGSDILPYWTNRRLTSGGSNQPADGTVIVDVNGEAYHPGIKKLHLPNTDNNIVASYLSLGSVRTDGSHIKQAWLIRPKGLTNHHLCFGTMNNRIMTYDPIQPPSNGVYVMYETSGSAASWKMVSRRNDVQTVVTGTSVDSNSWVLWEIEIDRDRSFVRFYRNDMLEAEITNNIPSVISAGAVRLCRFGGSSALSGVDIDLFQLSIKVKSQRY